MCSWELFGLAPFSKLVLAAGGLEYVLEEITFDGEKPMEKLTAVGHTVFISTASQRVYNSMVVTSTAIS